jgi:hypothetical protein
MRPHAVIHRRSEQHGPAVSKRRLGQHVVSLPVRKLRKRVRRARRHDEQIRALEMRIEIVRLSATRERKEGLASDELLRPARRQRHNIVPRLDEKPNELASLVRRNPAGYSHQDVRHAPDSAQRPSVGSPASPGCFVRSACTSDERPKAR